MSSTALSVVENRAPATFDDFDEKRIKLIRETFANDAPPLEFDLFLAVCQRTGLSPEAKQIYFIGRRDGESNRKKWTIQTSIDGYRLIADRSRAYAGSDDPVFEESGQLTGPNGKVRPDKATVTVWKIVQGIRCPFTASARWDEYNAGVNLWKRMPYTMLAKCAEGLALRKAFPAELSGLYSDVEMDQAGGDVVDATVTVKPTATRTRVVPGGQVDEETGEFRRVPDDAPESSRRHEDSATKRDSGSKAESRPVPSGEPTAPSDEAAPADYRKKLYKNSRGLQHPAIHDLALFTFPGLQSVAAMTEQQTDQLLSWMNSATPAAFDQVVATIEKWKAEGAWPPNAAEPAEPAPLLSFTAFSEWARSQGFEDKQAVEAYLGESIKHYTPQQVKELIEAKQRDLAALDASGK